MIDSEKIQLLAQLNQEMTDAVAKLQEALKSGNSLEIERLKASALVLQKKISNVLS